MFKLNSFKLLKIRYLGATNLLASAEGAQSIALKIGIIWGEERQRQRLKQFGKLSK